MELNKQDVIEWLRQNPDVDIKSLASDAKCEWASSDPCSTKTISVDDSLCERVIITLDTPSLRREAIILSKPDAEAFANCVLEIAGAPTAARLRAAIETARSERALAASSPMVLDKLLAVLDDV